MKIHRMPNNPLEENTYVVSFADKRAVIIDCGAVFQSEKQRVSDYIRDNELTPVAHLLTHGHFDHCFGVRFIWQTYGLRPVLAEEDAFIFEDQVEMLRRLTGMDYPGEPFLEYHPLAEYDLKPLHCRAIHTPGHTPGGVCYLFEEDGETALFSGDTLFRGSVGRTDHEGGNMLTELQSVRTQLFTLPDELVVFPGHGPRTSIGWEKQYNMFLQ
nr:MBL fold metallo-hydrolase [Paludibacteraceae bacterium]